MSHLPDEMGRHGSARHNSSANRDTLGAINYLRRMSVEGTCLETTMPTNKEAP
jgi:hypothetical protein